MFARHAQIHMFTCYAPSNLNRDDRGKPKVAVVGGTPRLRVSSQSRKRSVRKAEVFEEALKGFLGERTKRFGSQIEEHLVGLGGDPAVALEVARQISVIFGDVEGLGDSKAKATKAAKNGKNVKGNTGKTEAQAEASEGTGDGPSSRLSQLCFISPAEQKAALALAEKMLEECKGDVTKVRKIDRKKDAPLVLLRTDTAVDLAMFGRMLAALPQYNREAAVQVAHAVTTHKARIEDDYFTAVDDLQKPEDDEGEGAAHLGELPFGSGIFYQYVAVNRKLLVDNLGGDQELAANGLRAFIEALATVSPTGKQASYASRAYASYIMAEIGNRQPRNLIAAFQRAVTGEDLLAESIAQLNATRNAMDRAYGPCADLFAVMDVPNGKGTLADIQALITEGLA
jgi:CRISPR system Cascade subunit CasC